MGSSYERSKRKIQIWKKALIHFSLCFVMGFFTGFAPTSRTLSLLYARPSSVDIKNLGVSDASTAVLNQSILARLHPKISRSDANIESKPTPIHAPFSAPSNNDDYSEQIIVITTTHSNDPFKVASLWRLANTLKLVRPPLLWIVVEAYFDAPMTAKILRQTGIMYRHVTCKENFTDADAESYHQTNAALNHVEQHRLSGIVLFARSFNIYPLQFFEEIRAIEVFGAWPVAMVSAGRKRINIEGPICNYSKVVSWASKEPSNGTVERKGWPPERINISGFAFNSSILWDPERWGRPSSISDISQDSIRFIHQVFLEDETKIKAIPSDCSKVMTWHLHIQRSISH